MVRPTLDSATGTGLPSGDQGYLLADAGDSKFEGTVSGRSSSPSREHAEEAAPKDKFDKSTSAANRLKQEADVANKVLSIPLIYFDAAGTNALEFSKNKSWVSWVDNLAQYEGLLTPQELTEQLLIPMERESQFARDRMAEALSRNGYKPTFVPNGSGMGHLSEESMETLGRLVSNNISIPRSILRPHWFYDSATRLGRMGKSFFAQLDSCRLYQWRWKPVPVANGVGLAGNPAKMASAAEVVDEFDDMTGEISREILTAEGRELTAGSPVGSTAVETPQLAGRRMKPTWLSTKGRGLYADGTVGEMEATDRGTYLRGAMGTPKISLLVGLFLIDGYATYYQIRYEGREADSFLLGNTGFDTLTKILLGADRYVGARIASRVMQTRGLRESLVALGETAAAEAPLLEAAPVPPVTPPPRLASVPPAGAVSLSQAALLEAEIAAGEQAALKGLKLSNGLRAGGMGLAMLGSLFRLGYDVRNWRNGTAINAPMIAASVQNITELTSYIYKPIIGLLEARKATTVQEAMRVLQNPNLPSVGWGLRVAQAVRLLVAGGAVAQMVVAYLYWQEVQKITDPQERAKKEVIAYIGLAAAVCYAFGNMLKFNPPTAPIGMGLIIAGHCLWVYQMYKMYEDPIDEWVVQELNHAVVESIKSNAANLIKNLNQNMGTDYTFDDVQRMMSATGMDDIKRQERADVSKRASWRVWDKATVFYYCWKQSGHCTYNQKETLRDMVAFADSVSGNQSEQAFFVFLVSQTVFTRENFGKLYDSPDGLYLQEILNSQEGIFVQRLFDVQGEEREMLLVQLDRSKTKQKQIIKEAWMAAPPAPTAEEMAIAQTLTAPPTDEEVAAMLATVPVPVDAFDEERRREIFGEKKQQTWVDFFMFEPAPV